MKELLLAVSMFCTVIVLSQESSLYVAARTGLNVRESPKPGATLLGKIPYGEKIILQDSNEGQEKVNTEGMSGNWRKVQFNGRTGYVIDSYLLPSPPPKPGTKTMKDYLVQISSFFGSKLVVKSGNEETGSELHKQLFRNGAEWHEFRGYEYGSDTYFLPGFLIQQGFLLTRLLAEFNEVIGEKDEFPVNDKIFRKGTREYSIKTEKETVGNNVFVKKIAIQFEDGAMYNFEMYQIDNQLVIFYGSGV